MKMTAEKIERAREMRAEGLSYAKIGEALGVGHSTIRYQLDPACKEYHTVYRGERKDGKNAYMRDYYAANKDAMNAKHRTYVAAHEEELQAYRDGRKEETRAYNARYHEVNRARLNERSRLWNDANRDKAEAWRKAHRPELAAKTAARRALIAGATLGNLAEIAEIYRRAKEEPNIRCYLCGKMIPLGSRHVDHVYPISGGGMHRPANLAVACSSCNVKKHDKLPEEIGLLL